MKPLQLWQLNLVVRLLENELSSKVNVELDAANKLKVDPKESADTIKELYSNQFHDIGKAKITLDAITGLRDNLSEEINQELCTHDNIGGKEDESAKCSDCGRHMGSWYCEKSPDHCCHYFSDKMKDGYYIVLNQRVGGVGKAHKVLNYSKSKHENENEDSCIFCGNPEERK